MSHLGKRHSPEVKAKMSAAHRGMRFSPEVKAKMSAAHRGKKHTAETRAKISASVFGKRHTQETKMQIRATKLAKYGLAPKHFDTYCLARRKGFTASEAVAFAFHEAKRLEKKK